MGAQLNMEIARRASICISGDMCFIKKKKSRRTTTMAGSSFIFFFETDRQTDWGTSSFAVSAAKTLQLFFNVEKKGRVFVFCGCCVFFFFPCAASPLRSSFYFFEPPPALPPEVVSLDTAPPSIILSASERLVSDGCKRAARRRG